MRVRRAALGVYFKRQQLAPKEDAHVRFELYPNLNSLWSSGKIEIGDCFLRTKR